jgi:hypothetical protein
VAEVCCQTDFIDGSSKIISTAAPAVVIPAAQLRSDSPDVGPSLASSQTPASPKNELTRKIEMALLAASVNSSVSKSDVAHENRAVQTDSSATAALVNVPPAATPLKFARQRRQVLQLTLVQDQPVSKTPPSFAVQGEPCPRQAPHHGPNQAAYSLVTVGLQTDAQLLYDYIAVVSKMMLRSGAPCPEAPPSVAPTIVQTTAPGQQGSEASVLKNAGQAQEEPHPWQSFFKNRRPVSATKR